MGIGIGGERILMGAVKAGLYQNWGENFCIRAPLFSKT